MGLPAAVRGGGTRFRFQFGQRVRVLAPPAELGATGRIISGRLYPDGRETYCVDVPGGSWSYAAHELEDADEAMGR